MRRGVALLAPALVGIPVAEYGAKTIKLAVVGTGGATRCRCDDGAAAVAGGGDAAGRCGGCAGGGDLPCASPGQRAALGGRGADGVIAKLRDRVEQIEADRCVIDVNGVGYLVQASHADAGGAAGGRGGERAGRDAGARGCDPAVRFRRRRRSGSGSGC